MMLRTANKRRRRHRAKRRFVSLLLAYQQWEDRWLADLAQRGWRVVSDVAAFLSGFEVAK